ncbi:hypothetical protein J0S82_002818 [Galemys pyrenaicus]|uniref:Uncharacterized protein n=1 Tax=Galemys pyrenaicus TaxID=202257 RepID=A0A8J5ZY37_GALPY|nr:hypothetical protein J0S82_002818 [Galemys pyrenaicus]
MLVVVSAEPLQLLDLETGYFSGSRDHASVIKTGTHLLNFLLDMKAKPGPQGKTSTIQPQGLMEEYPCGNTLHLWGPRVTYPASDQPLLMAAHHPQPAPMSRPLYNLLPSKQQG